MDSKQTEDFDDCDWPNLGEEDEFVPEEFAESPFLPPLELLRQISNEVF